MSNRNLDRRSLLLAGAGVATTDTLVTFEPASAGVRTRTKVFKGHFRGDVADWHYLPFRVPAGVTRISVKYLSIGSIPAPSCWRSFRQSTSSARAHATAKLS